MNSVLITRSAAFLLSRHTEHTASSQKLQGFKLLSFPPLQEAIVKLVYSDATRESCERADYNVPMALTQNSSVASTLGPSPQWKSFFISEKMLLNRSFHHAHPKMFWGRVQSATAQQLRFVLRVWAACFHRRLSQPRTANASSVSAG